MKKRRRRRIILILILAGLGFGFYYLWVRLPIINGYAAKNLCSCVFMADRNSDEVETQELDYSFVTYASNDIDYENRKVTSSFWGMRSQTASYREGFGCVLDGECGFGTSMALSEGIESSVLEERLVEPIMQAINHHFDEGSGARSVIVADRNGIIGEKHSEGFEETPQLGWSMTKSIMNALVGIAIQQGKIKSIDDPVPLEFVGGKKITWNQLLQMNSGISWTEDYGTVSEATQMLYESCDMVSFVASLDFEAEPGKHWEYSSGTTNLISGALKKLYDNDEYWKLPYQELFNPCGMSSMKLETDGIGTYVGSSYSWATAKDWTKFGLLYLNNGQVNGKQILPLDWAGYSAEPAPQSGDIYGAQFWLQNDEEYPNAPKDMYFADGFQGQRIFIFPTEGIVIVRLGLTKEGKPNYDKLIKEVLTAYSAS